MRSFHGDGFVHEYRFVEGAPDGSRMVFETVQVENGPAGMQARETLVFDGPTTSSRPFELAMPGDSFEPYTHERLRRLIWAETSPASIKWCAFSHAPKVRSAPASGRADAHDPFGGEQMHISRQRIRYVGAAASATMAVIYFLIGLRIFDIGGSTTGDTVDVGLFGASAGSAFLALAVLLLLTDRRWLWIPAVLLQVFVYAIYIGTSGIRVPLFEIYGVTLRIVQIPLVLALVYLSVKAPMSTRTPRGGQDPSTSRHIRIGA